jgi:photosystem II stability/assembly factor-like uncharacterized protein
MGGGILVRYRFHRPHRRIGKKSEGVLLYTEDGGEHWIERHRFPWSLHHLQFINDRKGWIIGTERLADKSLNGVILTTEDGGESWRIQYKGVNEILSDSRFTDENNGWVLGMKRDGSESFLLHTTDGGRSWRRISLGGRYIVATDFVDDKKGWMVESKDVREGNRSIIRWTIFHTHDGGESWVREKSGEEEFSWLFALHFIDGNKGWAVMGSTILHTDDGGRSWTVQDYKLISRGKELKLRIGGIYFLDERRGWIVGTGILYTTDGGMTWHQERQRPFSELNLNGVIFVSSREGWVVGEGGVIFHTTDGGLTWQRQESSISTDLLGVYFINSKEGWVVGDEGTILHTTDGGNTWVRQKSGTKIPLNDVQFLNEKEGWIVGGQIFPPARDGIILHTTDGGRKWRQIQIEHVRGWLRDVHFVNKQIGWIVGLATIIKTEDGGKSWQVQPWPGIDSRLTAIYFLDPLTGWVISWSDIAHTTDGGGAWQVQYRNKNTSFEKVYFANNNEGWAVGNVILHTTDGGRTWIRQLVLGPLDKLRSICYGGRGVLYAVGEYGILLRYHDPDLRIIPPSYWAVEPRGKGISSWGGIKQEGKRQVTSAPVLRNQLHQNYPNPFNLETWIPFQLAGESEVIIRIYDVQGGLVRELLLGRRKAGYYLDKRHAVRWDGRDSRGVAVSSGVYFYTLTAKGYTATRKLIVLK